MSVEEQVTPQDIQLKQTLFCLKLLQKPMLNSVDMAVRPLKLQNKRRHAVRVYARKGRFEESIFGAFLLECRAWRDFYLYIFSKRKCPHEGVFEKRRTSQGHCVDIPGHLRVKGSTSLTSVPCTCISCTRKWRAARNRFRDKKVRIFVYKME